MKEAGKRPKIIKIDAAGFCSGVSRAVKMTEAAAAEGAYALGYVIHNSAVVDSLRERGLHLAQSVEEVPEGAAAVIRAHGEMPRVYAALREKGVRIVDTTCPFVSKIHRIVEEKSKKGFEVLIIGTKNHPEAAVISEMAGGAEIVETPEELELWLAGRGNGPEPPLCAVAQTTADREIWEICVKKIKTLYTNAEIFDTICNATNIRQSQTLALAKIADVMIVIGDEKSTNTKRLEAVCRRHCPVTLLVSGWDGLAPHWEGILSERPGIVGVAAGASTPDVKIEEVINKMSYDEKLIANGEAAPEAVTEETAVPAEMAEETEAAAVPAEAQDATRSAGEAVENTEEAVETVPESAKAQEPAEGEEPAEAKPEAPETTEAPEESEESVATENDAAGQAADADTEQAEDEPRELTFEEMVDQSMKTLRTGQRVTGVVTRITGSEVHVDLGTKHAGFIPLSELSDDPSLKVEDIAKVGGEIEVFVTKVNDSEGTVSLSRKRIDAARGWESIDAARAERALLEGTVVEDNKGGIVVSVNGVRVFVPASHTGLPKEADMSEMLKKRVTLRITEVNRPKRRVIGSIRYANEDMRKSAAAKIWENIEVGNIYEGVVKSLTSFGAFIDIGGADGMAHITELSWSRLKHPSEAVSVGDKVTARVIALDPEKKKISLTLKSEADNPWTKFVDNFRVGDIIEVKVVKLMTFGAFAEVLPGVDGLIHISQLSDKRIGRPQDVVTEGDIVRAKIVDINTEKEKISLSVRAALEEMGIEGDGYDAEPQPEEAAGYAEDAGEDQE